jgi:hypothetical protein
VGRAGTSPGNLRYDFATYSSTASGFRFWRDRLAKNAGRYGIRGGMVVQLMIIKIGLSLKE